MATTWMNDPQLREKVARAVVEAAIAGDAATAKKFGISRATLRRWRHAVERAADRPADRAAVAAAQLKNQQAGQAVADQAAEELLELTLEKRELADRQWMSAIPDALADCVAYIRRAAGTKRVNAEMLHSVAGAMKLMAETSLSWQVFGARLRREAGQGTQADRQDSGSAGNVVPFRATGTGSGRGEGTAAE